ncbi:uncharacterized protein LOC125679296 isoform X2 [Ostrea edulis]|uniref:uncharacterized protein LOC125679296 isoform X2 n=1 Tax=Ostrea edulis TaxID=37623 RepID=UPI0024AFB127|nr:uncharacterized protein LOC125679296 isoform X2 [Ostrea edulis]
MPLKRRRNSGHGDGSDRDIKLNSIGVDSTGIASEKGSKTFGKREDTGIQHEKASNSKSSNVKSSGHRDNGEARVGACTRSRIVKKPKRDLSPPESPVKKQVQKEIKSNTPEIKTKRQWELWSSEDKDAFFEALFEHGKDFDAIQNWIATKCRRKNVVPGLIKNKDQVRHLYYRTWHKISKFIKVDTEVKKEIQELYGLINYGVLRKKIKGVLNEKVGTKLNELVYTGCTAVKVRGKNVRIKTPMCNALKKLNNIDESSTISKGKKTEAIVPIPVCDNSVDGVESVLGKTFDSPKLSKGSKDSAKTDCGSAFTVTVGAIVEGDNAMFPDTLLSPSQKKESNILNTEGSSNTIELSCVKDKDGCVPLETDAANEQQDGCGSDKKTEHTVEELADIESRKMKEALEGGLTSDRADMTLAELYLMFGKDGKLRMEYEWYKDEIIPQHLCNMLRRLVNLAAIQFADLSTKSPSTNSPCHACGMLKNKSRVSNARGPKNRYLLPSKYGERFTDASTQTSVSHPVLKNVDNSGPKDAVFRVPVCSPAFLQRSLALPSRSKPNQINANTNFLPPQRGVKKIRTNRKQLSIQRNILPKQPMVAVLRPSMGRQPLPFSVCPPVNLFNVPNNGVRLQPRVATTTGTPGGTPVQLNVRPQSPQVEATPVPDNNNICHLLSGINIDLHENTTPVPLTNSASVKDTIPHSTLSPPNMPSLLDISLSNLPTGSSENYDKLIDLALGNSNSTFSTLLEPQNQDVLNTPKKNPNKYSSPPGSPANPWLNTGEDGGDLTFMNLLSDSPLKPPNHVSTASSMVLQTTPLFSESSRDSIMGRLDVDGTLQSVLNENSIDYAVKFQDLAAHITGNTDCSLLLRKTDSSG